MNNFSEQVITIYPLDGAGVNSTIQRSPVPALPSFFNCPCDNCKMSENVKLFFVIVFIVIALCAVSVLEWGYPA